MSILILLFGINVCMESNKIKKNPQKFTGSGPGSTRNLLVLNIGMEEIKFVEHKINLHPYP
jgi:hypothetical protein